MSIYIYHVPGNATMQSFIQVRREKDDVEEIIENFENYDKLKSCKLISPDSLRLKLTSSVSTNRDEMDTVIYLLKPKW